MDRNFGIRTGAADSWVASRTEAWIETDIIIAADATAAVASRTEAWIETRGRLGGLGGQQVASRTEAWIETPIATSAQWRVL